MGYNLNDAEGTVKTFEPLDDGVYDAYLYGFIDLGVQPRDSFGDKKKLPCPHIMLCWAYVDEMQEDDDGNETDEHRIQSENFGAFKLTSDAATSTKRYRVLDPAGKHEGDISECVGEFAKVEVKKKFRKKDQKPYNIIANAMPMRPKELEKMPEMNVETFQFFLSAPEERAWNRLFGWQKEMVLNSINLDSNTKELLETWNSNSESEGATDGSTAPANPEAEKPEAPEGLESPY